LPSAQHDPDHTEAIAQYRRAATGYDRHMRTYVRWHRKAVDRLELEQGQTVIDVACDTGLNFPLLEEKIGAGGRIVGIDLSPDMLAVAGERVAAKGWDNVTLVEVSVDEANVDATADAALFSFTHDVLQSSRAVANVVAHLRPGARVASVGAKLGARWNVVVNFFVRRTARPYVTTFRGLDRPWRGLELYGEINSKTWHWAVPIWRGGALAPRVSRKQANA
jgi:ubiquinone/menaquinone biosynthesis C-methylase UbiE